MTETRSLVFIVTEDWFFVSHFLPMIGAARRAGFDPVVLTRVGTHGEAIRAAGGRVIAFEADRRSLDPLAIARAVRGMARILRAERAAAVHCISLRSILVGGAAARLARVPARIFAVTGGGFLSARTDRAGRAGAAVVALVIRRLLAGPSTQFLFENRDDPVSFGLDPDAGDVTVVGGAGVDPSRYPDEPSRPGEALRVALVSRMLWSKGVDLAVEAVALARARGATVELSLFGAPDASNPRAIPEARLRIWSELPGVRWHGPTSDVAGVWRTHDIAILPSRGGEGLPRTLLEAAASTRAVVTTDVPGCRSFVRDGTDGFVVAPEDAEALAEALCRLDGDRALLNSMQRNARARVADGFTEAQVSAAVEALYRRVATLTDGGAPAERRPRA